MKKHQLKVAAIALLLTGLTMSVSAQQRGQGKGQCLNNSTTPRCERFLPDLTEAQQESISELRVEHIGKMNVLHADMQIKKAELHKMELANNYNQKNVEAKIDEMYALKATMAKERSMHRQKVRSLLTDEQKVVFDAHSYRGKGHGHGAGNGYAQGPGGGKALCAGTGPR